MNQQQIVALVLLALVAAVVVGYFFGYDHGFEQASGEADEPRDGVFCTQEAKECPDGSYVGRQGPNCEFAPCPGE